IVPLSQGQLSGGRISSGAAEIYPTGVAFTDSIKNNFVSTFRATNMFTDNGKSDDQSIIASVGPYDINAKDTVRAAFAVISGSSLGDLIATARLAQRDYVAIGNAFGPVTKVNPEEIPLTFALDQNFPNPFNPTTMIRFALPKESKVSLKVYDVIGREVRTLVNGDLAAGINTVEWNGRNNLGQAVASGMYLYRIQAGTFVSTKKMMLLK
ncbi:MAG: T9SS type A sorting domain-containing protein, partial [Bacteroidota bacterium]